MARHAGRQAELLRRADHYAAEGLHGIADHLRRQAEALDVQRPLAGVLLPAVNLLHDTPHDEDPKPPRLRLVGGDPPQRAHLSWPQPRKRGA